jgi:tRNA(Ile)-lysidine synthase
VGVCDDAVVHGGADLAGLGSRCSFPGVGTAVTCAVSGGADSLALLVLACDAGLDVTAVHVDHGLRDGSAEEAEVVAAASTGYGAAFRAERVEVGAGPNLEARARAARRAVLGAGALTGHTADDQAETVVLNLLRGAGLDGLRGIPVDETKPLLRLRRAETHALCASVGLTPVVDPTNADRAWRRNRVRHEVLPLLDAVAERDLAAVLARQAELLADDAALLDALAAGLDPTDAKGLAAAPAPLARRAVRAWLRCGVEQHPPSAAAVERVLAVARGDAVACEVEGGRRVQRSHGCLAVLPATFQG